MSKKVRKVSRIDDPNIEAQIDEIIRVVNSLDARTEDADTKATVNTQPSLVFREFPSDPVFGNCEFVYDVTLRWYKAEGAIMYEIRTDLNWGNESGRVYLGSALQYSFIPGQRYYTFYIKSINPAGKYSQGYDEITLEKPVPSIPNPPETMPFFSAVKIIPAPNHEQGILGHYAYVTIEGETDKVDIPIGSSHVYNAPSGTEMTIEMSAYDILGEGGKSAPVTASTLKLSDRDIPEEIIEPSNLVKSLREDIDLTKTRAIDALAQISDLDSIVDDTIADLNAAKGRLTSAETEISNAKNRISTVETKIGEIDDEIEAAKDRLTSAETEITGAKNRLDSVETEVAGAKSRLSDAEDKLGTIDVEIAEAKDRISDAETDLLDAKNRLSGVEDEIADAKDRLLGAESRLSSIDDEIADAKDRLTDAESRLTAAETDLTDARTRLTDAESDLEGLEGVVSTHETKISNIQGELSTKVSQTEFNALAGTVSTQGTILAQHADQIAMKAEQSEVDTLSEAVANNTATLEVHATQIAARVTKEVYNLLENRVEEAEAELVALADEISAKVSQTVFEDLQRRVTDNEAELLVQAEAIQARVTQEVYDTLANRVTTVEGTLEVLPEQIALKASQSDVDALTGRVEDAEAELLVLATEISSKVSQTVFDTLSETVTSQGTQITQNATAIESKADQSVVDALSGTVSNHSTLISQNATAITQKADKSTVDALTGRVSAAEATLTTHADAIEARATKEEVDAIEDRVTAAEGQLSVQAGKIEAKAEKSEVQALEEDLSAVSNQVSTLTTSYDSISARVEAVEGVTDDLTDEVSDVKSRTGSLELRADNIEASVSSLEENVDEHGNRLLDVEHAVVNVLPGQIELKANASDVYTKAQVNTELGKKADKTDVDDLTARVSNAELTINAHEGAIAQKAERTEVYTKTETDAKLGTKVDITTYNQKVGELTTSIEGISGRVENTETNIDNLTGEISSVKSDVASLNIRADGIESSVSSLDARVEGNEIQLENHASLIQQNADGILSEVTRLDGKIDGRAVVKPQGGKLWHFDTSLESTDGIKPLDGAVATLRPNEGRFGGAVAVEEGTTNLVDPDPRNYAAHDWGSGSGHTFEDGITPGGYPFRKFIPGPNSSTNLLLQSPEFTLSVTEGEVYTASFLWWTDDEQGKLPQVGLRSKDSVYYHNVTAQTTVYIGDGWYRSTATFPPIPSGYSGSNRFRFLLRNGSIRAAFAYACPQLEAKPFATSFVDGTRAAGRLEYPAEVVPQNEGTIVGWFKMHPLGFVGYRYFWDSIGSRFAFYIRSSDKSLIARTHNSVERNFGSLGSGFDETEWHQYALTWTGLGLNAYVDGELVGSYNGTIELPLNSGNVRFGTHHSGADERSIGLIDELLILPYAATEEEIKGWYEAKGAFVDQAEINYQQSQIVQLADEISSKVSRDDFDALEDTVTAMGTVVTQTAEAVEQKAELSTVTELGDNLSQVINDVATLTTSYNSISARVESVEGDINTLTGEITGVKSRTSTLEQRAEGFDARVEAIEEDVDGLDGRISTAESNISANASAIELRATKSEVEDVSEKVTNLETWKGQFSVTPANINATVSAVNDSSTGLSAAWSEINQTPTKISQAVSSLRSDIDDAIADVYSDISQTASSINSTISSLQTNLEGQIAAGDSALSGQISAIEQTLSGITSTVADLGGELGDISTQVTQLADRYSVKIQKTIGDKTYATGFVSGINEQNESEFAVLADKFRVFGSLDEEGDGTALFVVDAQTNKAYLNVEEVIAAGAIKAEHLEADSVLAYLVQAGFAQFDEANVLDLLVDRRIRVGDNLEIGGNRIVVGGYETVSETVRITEDVFVRGGAPGFVDSNYSGSTSLGLGGDSSEPDHSLLKFNLPSGNITSATLRLYGELPSSGPFYIRVLKGDWNFQTVTWNNRPASDLVITTPTYQWWEGDRWFEIDITPVIQLWKQGQQNYGIEIYYYGGEAYAYSSRHPNPAYHPHVVFTVSSEEKVPKAVFGDLEGLDWLDKTLPAGEHGFWGKGVRIIGDIASADKEGNYSVLSGGRLAFFRATQWDEHGNPIAHSKAMYPAQIVSGTANSGQVVDLYAQGYRFLSEPKIIVFPNFNRTYLANHQGQDVWINWKVEAVDDDTPIFNPVSGAVKFRVRVETTVKGGDDLAAENSLTRRRLQGTGELSTAEGETGSGATSLRVKCTSYLRLRREYEDGFYYYQGHQEYWVYYRRKGTSQWKILGEHSHWDYRFGSPSGTPPIVNESKVFEVPLSPAGVYEIRVVLTTWGLYDSYVYIDAFKYRSQDTISSVDESEMVNYLVIDGG